MKLNCEKFQDFIDDNIIMSGDIIFIEKYNQNFLQKSISRIQYELLLDLTLNMNKDIAREFSYYTDCAIIISPNIVVELSKCEMMDLEDLLSQPCQLLIKRPRFLHEKYHDIEHRGDTIANIACQFAKYQNNCSLLKTLKYYFLYLKLYKLIFGRKMENIFKNNDLHISSGICLDICLTADAIDLNVIKEQDKNLSLWYPCRLAFDNEHFEIIGVFDITN